MKKIITLLALAAGLAASQAQSTLYWTWTGATPGDTGSGTLGVANLGGNLFLTTGPVSGEIDSDSVTGTILGSSVFYPRPDEPINGSLTFYTASDSYTISFTGDSPYPETIEDGNTSDTDPGVFALSATPAPEPGTLALAGLGASALLAFRRKK